MPYQAVPPQTRKILFFWSGDRAEVSPLLALLGESGDVSLVTTMQEAVAALEGQRFDLILLGGSELLPASVAAMPFLPGALLDQLDHGVCVVDREGQMLWCNPKLRSYASEVQEAIRSAAADVLAGYPRAPTDSAQVSPRQGLPLDVGGEFFFELAVGPLRGAEGEVDWAIAFALDRSRQRRLQEKINAIDAAGRELVRLDADAINRREVPERLQLLQEKILKYCHELLKFDHLVIRVLDRRANRLETVVAGGLSEEAQSLELYASPEGNGISGYVAATGRSYICDDILKDPRYLPGLEQARSSLTVPLWLNDQIVGTFNVESDKPASFTEDDRQMAEIFGRYIAIALHMLQLLVVERHTTAGQLAADVAAELSVPLNEIVAETQHLLERCADQGGLRQGLEAILRNVGRAREVLSSISEGAPLVGLAAPPPSRDPLLAGKRVLVADDEDIIRETVASVLTKAGAKTTPARDGNEALQLIAAQPFDLVLSDIKMPHKNGYEVFAAVRTRQPACPVILITGFGYDPNHSIVRASKEGLAGVLFKPFKVEQLLEEVRHALGGPRK